MPPVRAVRQPFHQALPDGTFRLAPAYDAALRANKYDGHTLAKVILTMTCQINALPTILIVHVAATATSQLGFIQRAAYSR